jgi:hypothetical protein
MFLHSFSIFLGLNVFWCRTATVPSVLTGSCIQIDFTADDVLIMTPKFWLVHLDLNIALDYRLFTILAAQCSSENPPGGSEFQFSREERAHDSPTARQVPLCSPITSNAPIASSRSWYPICFEGSAARLRRNEGYIGQGNAWNCMGGVWWIEQRQPMEFQQGENWKDGHATSLMSSRSVFPTCVLFSLTLP